MHVLVIGSGGREHAIVEALHRSASVARITCAPGNPGIAEHASCVHVDAGDVDDIERLSIAERPDLIVFGPEVPLVAGAADRLRARGVAVVGPGADGARLEGSKAHAKQLLLDAGVPTARHATFTDLEPALAHVRAQGAPIVVKADGLAAGKGVVVAHSTHEAEAALRDMLEAAAFGGAGARVVVEECLVGPELSVIALVSGGEVRVLAPSRDHKRAFDGDDGPNTGGMGAISPVPGVDDELLGRIDRQVFRPIVRELAARGVDYRGVLYAGIMLCSDGPKVIEFNVRFGDPEAQAILPRLRSDLGELLMATARGTLDCAAPIEWDERAAATVVVATDGYPAFSRTGMSVDLASVDDAAAVFHAGTARREGELVVAGGTALRRSCSTAAGTGPTSGCRR